MNRPFVLPRLPKKRFWVQSVALCVLLCAVSVAQAAQGSGNWPLDTALPQDARKGVANNPAPPQLPQALSLPLLAEAHKGLIRRVDVAKGHNYVALTFDLCELENSVSGFDVRLVNALRKHGVKATFFVGGKWMRSHPERTMQLMADPLFELGNHAWTHANFGTMPLDEAREQIVWTQAMYESLRSQLLAQGGANPAKVPPSMALFRFPYGRMRPETLHLVNSLGLAAIQWDVSGEQQNSASDPGALGPLPSYIRPGSIVLLHANLVPKNTAGLVEKLVPELLRQGYELLTVSELLAKGQPQTASDGYFLKPGDNRYLDDKFGRYGTGRR